MTPNGVRIREVLPESGSASAEPDACRDRRLQFGESQTVLVVEARNWKSQTYLRRFAYFRWNGLVRTSNLGGNGMRIRDAP